MLISLAHLPASKIRGAIHIGAHHAEELSSYLSHGITKIAWIVANPTNVGITKERISTHPCMTAYCFAASDISGQRLSLNVASNSQSSSLLQLGTHLLNHPNVNYVTAVEVSSLTIDDFVEAENIKVDEFNYMCLDIQGYEYQALVGAKQTLGALDYIYTEVNFEDVYRNVKQFKEINNLLNNAGFYMVCQARTPFGWGDAFYAKEDILKLKLSYYTKRLKAKLLRLISSIHR